MVIHEVLSGCTEYPQQRRLSMVGIGLGVLGIAVIAFTVFDILSTTFTLGGGGGLLTARLSKFLWSLALRRSRMRGCNPQTAHRHLMIGGYLISLLPFVVWIGLLWAGWAFIFSASPTAVVDAETDMPADPWARLYFTGFTLSTLGTGDYQPKGPFWQIVTAIASLTGFFLMTFTISCLVPIVAAATQERQLAAYISVLGKRAADIVVQAWNGRDFGALPQHLVSLTPLVALHAQLYPAYPMLRYFHSINRTHASAPSLAALDEALTLLEYGVQPEYRPDSVVLYSLRQAVSEYIETLNMTYVQPSSHAPPLTLDLLRARGIPTVSEPVFQAALTQLTERRRLLLASVQADGWTWDDVAGEMTGINRLSSEARSLPSPRSF